MSCAGYRVRHSGYCWELLCWAQGWRQRAGNEIANQLYGSGDYLNALSIYSSLANLDLSPRWRMPAWYQIGLVYERLQQPQKALEAYDKILASEKDLDSTTTSPNLDVIREMAKWRRNYLGWLMQAERSNERFSSQNSVTTANESNITNR